VLAVLVVVVAGIVAFVLLVNTSDDSSSSATDDGYVPLEDERPMYLQPGMTANTEALCNNGEPATWHFREALPGDNALKWIIRFEGGNCCFDANTCDTRWEDDNRYMTPAATEVIYQDQMGGVLNGSPQKNRLFHDYNAIHMHYCSSDAWMGSRDVGEGTNDSPYVFKGYHIVMGLFDQLEADNDLYNFLNADQVVISGCSAGGLPMVSIGQAIRDKVRGLLPDADIIHVADSGWFMLTAENACEEDMICDDFRNCPMEEQFAMGYDFWGTMDTLDPACTAVHGSNCSAPEYSYPFLSEDMKEYTLVVQSEYDQMQHDMHVSTECHMSEEEDTEFWEALMVAYRASVEEAGLKYVASTMCSNHDILPNGDEEEVGWVYSVEFMADDKPVADVIWDFISGVRTTATSTTTSVYRMEDDCEGKDCNPTCPVHIPPLHID
jgi:hypothetical protein